MESAPRRLLVDGHNVLYAWGWLGSRRSSSLAIAGRRAELAAALRAIHDVESVTVSIVFDGNERAVGDDHAESTAGCAVLFAPPDLTADGVIERLVASADDARVYTVATADRLVRETVFAAGGSCVSPEELRAWVDRCRDRAAQQARARAARQRGSFENRLPL